MTAESTEVRTMPSRVVFGVVSGVLAGLLVDLFFLRGLLIAVALAVASAFVRPRFVALGAVLIGAGGLWFPYAAWASVMCVANPSSCSGPSPIPFAIMAAMVLAAGVLTFSSSRRRIDGSRGSQ